MENWRYIRYAEGSEELYDMVNHPEEWNNHAHQKEHLKRKDSLSAWLPKRNHLPLIENRLRVPESLKDTLFWEGRPFLPGQAIPGL